MKLTLLVTLILTTTCYSQTNKPVGGGCDGCELMYSDMPQNISSISYSPAWNSAGQKLLITGKAYKQDGLTPAANIIIYYWQTNHKGYYVDKNDLNIHVKRHGYIRGWVKSDNQGRYSIYTIKPGAYPNKDIPAHIHLSIKEPDIKDEYYVDNLVFDYDPLLTTEKRKALKNRGGSGLLRTLKGKNILIAEHNIILGLNIPNYPKVNDKQLKSGQKAGEDFHSITPYHAWGPDRGTTTCPVCRYGRYFGIMYFVNEINSQEINDWLLFLEQLSGQYDQQLKVYLIYGSARNYSFSKRNKQLAKLGEKLKLQKVALTFVPAFDDKETDIYLSRINSNARNTLVIYKNRNIISNSTNLIANQKNFKIIQQKLTNSTSDYFNLQIDKTR